MPLFEYVCENCGKHEEIITLSGTKPDPPMRDCPICKSAMFKKFAENPLFLGDLASKRHFQPSDYGRSGK
jgi:putative FmdB family regulatory protein